MLRKAQGLRNNVRLKKVFVSTDRTIAQRVQHRQLVTQLKEQAADDKSRRYFIRNGEIQSEERVQGEGGEEKVDIGN